MNELLISVIVPCYNEKEYIEKCIVSILNQSIPEDKMEIFVVDGMSNDGTLEILSRLQNKFNRFKIIINKKQKTPFARNLGIKEANGKFIAILDAHSVYNPNYLSESISIIENHPEISCAGGPIESTGINNFGKATALSMSHPLGIGNAKHRYPEYEGYAEGACFPIFKREVFSQIGNFDEKLIRNQDDEFYLRMKKKKMKVYISPRAKCTYYVREKPGALFKQYFAYGYWRVAVIKKHKIAMSFRQLAPITLLLFILWTILIAPFIKLNPFITIFTIPVTYLIVLFIASIPIIVKNGIKIGSLFIFSAVILHFSYALGFVKGLFKFII